MQRATTGPNEYSEVSTKTSASTEPSNSMSTNKDLAKPSPDSRRQYLVISKETMLFWYTGVLGNVSVQKKSKITNKALNVHVVHEGSVSEESIYIFRPSFVKNQYELRFVKRRGHVFRNLSIDCVVDFKAPVFNMCRAGNIKGLREAFESGSVSPNVVNPFGMTLLHVSIITRPLSTSSDI